MPTTRAEAAADARPATGRAEVGRTIAPLLAEPRVASAQISQRLAGQQLEVLDRADDWLLVRGDDGYAGWMHHGYVCEPVRPGAQTGARRLSLGCQVRDHATGRLEALPLGALVPAGATVLDEGNAIPMHEVSARFPRTADAITRTAVERFAGAPYLWGGITPWGADCSGLVQTAFGLHGVPLPRDSWQQAQCGAGAAGELPSLRPADLLFFTDRPDQRVSHVAIALGGMRIVHLALGRGGHAIECLDDGRDPYVAMLRARFRFARRVL